MGQNAGDEIRRRRRVDWSHTRETSIKYHQADPTMEPTRKDKKKTPKKYVEKGSPDRHKEDRLQLDWRELEKKAQDNRLF